jgi:hypothetical protein
MSVRFASSLGVVMAAGMLACAPTTVRSITPAGGAPTYKIECVELDGCLSEAQRQCHGAYRTVSTEQNTIAESDLPGLNARTQRQNVSSNGLGIESDEPMRLTQVVVVCNG